VWESYGFGKVFIKHKELKKFYIYSSIMHDSFASLLRPGKTRKHVSVSVIVSCVAKLVET